MLTPEKAKLLTMFLGSLPERMAVLLARAVELDRLNESDSLPHQAILDALRPALRKSAAQRTPAPLRLFCLPFELGRGRATSGPLGDKVRK